MPKAPLVQKGVTSVRDKVHMLSDQCCQIQVKKTIFTELPTAAELLLWVLLAYANKAEGTQTCATENAPLQCFGNET